MSSGHSWNSLCWDLNSPAVGMLDAIYPAEDRHLLLCFLLNKHMFEDVPEPHRVPNIPPKQTHMKAWELYLWSPFPFFCVSIFSSFLRPSQEKHLVTHLTGVPLLGFLVCLRIPSSSSGWGRLSSIPRSSTCCFLPSSQKDCVPGKLSLRIE